MKHSINFINTENTWDNALPLGNGCFGAMLYYEDGKLHMPMNHYEVYYNIDSEVLPKDKLKKYEPLENPGTPHKLARERADANRPAGEETFTPYMLKKEDAFSTGLNPVVGFSGSYPSTGNISFGFAKELNGAEQSLTLYVEDATCRLSLSNDSEKLTINTITAREDCIINHIVQSKEGLLKSMNLEFPPCRDIEYPDIEYIQIDENTFVCTVRRVLGKDDNASPFVFSDIIKLTGAKGTLHQNEYGARITLEEASNDFFVITGVVTQFTCKDTIKDGIIKVNEYASDIDGLYREHKQYWTDFFARSSITLPDRFLENIYYVNQYALDCCSGKDGIMKHHACGLNGLWDVKHPNLWGSMWYWDVNIQAAFAGVFSSNRLDLARVFSDGLRSYVELAKKSAVDIHGARGIAGDYPYTLYYCVWPWCAQYLWFLYEYSLDKEYLEKEAFPVFEGLCEFYADIFRYDAKRGYYSVYPDISPEQGPMAHDTVITVASVKYLFKFTLKAAEILGKEDLPILSKCRDIMNNMAPYPVSGDGKYGIHFRDSHDAPDELWIRHPSMLMPLFPIGEFDLSSDRKMLKILSNTVDFLYDHAEIGIFGGSWIAAAAARLGRGQTAIRLLYERGIDHMLRSNGLTAEETERFINYCLILRQPLYYPCMMEFTGEMLAAVNEMLLQSHNDIIRVFPAIPDGNPEYDRMHRNGYPLFEKVNRYVDYESWQDVSFHKLLAKGAFEVSARLSGRVLEHIEVHSQKGGRVNITSPFITDEFKVFCEGNKVHFDRKDGIISFEADIGKTYLIAVSCAFGTAEESQDTYQKEILSRMTYTKRRIFLGEDPEAKYQKSLDYFIRDWYLGNVRMSNHLMYKFDFSKITDKRYEDCLFRMFYGAEERMAGTMAFNTFEGDKLYFTPKQGYGFKEGTAVTIVDRNSPDLLRRDFAQGTEDVEFIIEAPRGQYELFVVSGDSEEDSVTVLEAVNGRKAGGEVIKKGEYQCKVLPLVNEKDEHIRLKISTKEGYSWKVNYIMLNAVKGY